MNFSNVLTCKKPPLYPSNIPSENYGTKLPSEVDALSFPKVRTKCCNRTPTFQGPRNNNPPNPIPSRGEERKTTPRRFYDPGLLPLPFAEHSLLCVLCPLTA
jgi:hypothetical protein